MLAYLHGFMGDLVSCQIPFPRLDWYVFVSENWLADPSFEGRADFEPIVSMMYCWKCRTATEHGIL